MFRKLRLPRKVKRFIGVMAFVMIGWLGWSIGGALTAPGTDSVSARLAGWGRDHYFGGLVTAGEKLQYWLHPPKIGGTPSLGLIHGVDLFVSGAHPPIIPFALPALPGEGVFHTLVKNRGKSAIAVTYLRPDSTHSSYLASVVWMNGSLVKLVQHPGYKDPGHLSLWSQPDTISIAERAGLLATFNSGFKMKDAHGAFYANGNMVGKLNPGAASLIIYKDGHTDVGMWGNQVILTPDVLSVRQNLTLLINHGAITVNSSTRLWPWASTMSNNSYIWRSGIGVTASGDLVYVIGDALSLHSLASILLRAGAVRAMELDINSGWVSYMWYGPGPTATTPVPHKLLPFHVPLSGYFTQTSRDFFAVYSR